MNLCISLPSVRAFKSFSLCVLIFALQWLPSNDDNDDSSLGRHTIINAKYPRCVSVTVFFRISPNESLPS